MVDREEVAVSQAYLDTVLCWFSAQIEKVPLGDLADNLSKWADKNTAGLIKKTGVQVTGDTALVLQNALLFAARWSTPFNAEGTAEEEARRPCPGRRAPTRWRCSRRRRVPSCGRRR